MSNSIFNVGISGLQAAQINLTVTGQNIANATTPGYHVQNAVQTAAGAQYTGVGYIGQGVQTTNVVRVYNQYLDMQVNTAQAQVSYTTAYQTQVSQIDNLISGTGTSVSASLQSFFQSIQNLTTNPQDPATRETVLSDGNALASTYNLMNQQLQSAQSNVNSQVIDTTAQINSLAQQIAAINGQVALAKQSSTTQQPNDLLDQRDQLVNQLNQLVKTTSVQDPTGALNVYIGSGQGLVVGEAADTLKAQASASNPQQLSVYYQQKSGGSTLINSDMLSGGSLGGLLDFQNGTLSTVQNEIGRSAIVLASAFNAQSQAGQDLNGSPGTAFFNVGVPTTALANSNNTGNGQISIALTNASQLTTDNYQVDYNSGKYTVTDLNTKATTTYGSLPQTFAGITLNVSGSPQNGDSFLVQPTASGAKSLSVLISDPSLIAAASPVQAAAANSNTGLATISSATVAPTLPLNANLTQPVSITFTSPTTYNVTGTGTGNPTGLSYTSGQPISYNGWSVTLNGAPAANDTFSVSANTSGTTDNGNALALASLQTQNLVGGTATLQGDYSSTVATVGNTTSTLTSSLSAQKTVLTQATAAQQSAEGVNLDQEAANLILYQQAYQASAKVMQTAQTLFSTLLNIA